MIWFLDNKTEETLVNNQNAKTLWNETNQFKFRNGNSHKAILTLFYVEAVFVKIDPFEFINTNLFSKFEYNEFN